MGHAVLGKQIKLLIVSTVSKGNMSNVRGKMASLFAVTEIFSLYILSAQKMSFCKFAKDCDRRSDSELLV